MDLIFSDSKRNTVHHFSSQRSSDVECSTDKNRDNHDINSGRNRDSSIIKSAGLQLKG